MLSWLELTAVLNRPIAFHRIFAEIGGGAIPGLFLSQAFYWTSRTKDPDGWFYKTQEDWQQETALIRSEQDRARRELKARNLIEETRQGLPCKLYYRVNKVALLEAISALVEEKERNSQFADSCKLDCSNEQTGLVISANTTAKSSKQSIYIDYSENTSKTTRNAPPEPGAPPTQDLCVSGEDSIQENSERIEGAGTSSLSLSKKAEFIPETEIAPEAKGSAAPCDNTTSQPSQYSLHPTAKQDAMFQRQKLEPWLDRPGLNGWKPGFIEFYRQYLSSTPRYMQTLGRLATPGDAKNSLIELTRSEEGRVKIANHWENYQASLQPPHQPVRYQAAPDTIHQPRKPIKLSGKKI